MSKILTKAAGTPDESVSVSFGAALTAKARYAGVYTDTATFAFDVVEQTYTLDDINADTHLYGITIPDSVTSIGEEAFALCFSLQNIKLSESISQIPKCLFEACYALENIEIPKSVTSIDTTAFRSSGLKTIYPICCRCILRQFFRCHL